MSDGKDQLTEELQYLRKGAGITLAKLAGCPEVLRVCGASNLEPQPALDRIAAMIDALRNRRSAQALLAAYALDGLEPLRFLKDRRARFAADRSSDTVENWENHGIAELRLLLLAQQPAIQPKQDTGGLPIGGYAMESLEAVYRYTDGCFTESVQTRDVIALVDNADGFIYATHVDTQLTVIRGGQPVVLDRSPEGWVRHKIMFPKPLARGESHQFVLRERLVVPETVRPDEDKISQIFHISTRMFWAEAQFTGEVPPLIWSFDKLTHFERPGATDARESGLAREESRHQGVQYALRRAVLWDRVALAHLGRAIQVDLYLGFALLRERMRNQRPARTIAKDLVRRAPHRPSGSMS